MDADSGFKGGQFSTPIDSKPLNFTEFAETVARLGVYWVATNDPPPKP